MPLDGTNITSTYRNVDPFILFFIAFAIVLTTVVISVGIIDDNNYKKALKLTDPKKGDVILSDTSRKYCDGTTLVYEIDRGGTAIPNSPECVSQ
jgi:hypothetical protein